MEKYFHKSPSDWKVYRLEDLCTLKGQYGLNKPAKNYNSSYPTYIRITDFDIDGKLDKQNLKSVETKEVGKYSLKVGDILFARTGATTGKTYLYKSADGDLVFAGFLIRFRIDKNLASKEYLFQLFHTNQFKKWVSVMSIRSGQPGINSVEYSRIKLSLPVLLEQKKIGNILTQWDKAINANNQKNNILKKQYRILQTKLYNSVFLNKTDDKYTRVALSSIFEEEIEKTTKNDQYDVLSCTKEDIFLQSDYFKRQIASKNNIGYKVLRKHRLVMSPQNAWMGNVNLNEKFELGMVSPSYKIFKVIDADILFVKHLIKSHRFIHLINSFSEQGASIVRKNLNLSEFLSIKINLPDFNIQNQIALVLESINKEIRLINDYNINLRVQKEGLMQRLLTGEIRVQH